MDVQLYRSVLTLDLPRREKIVLLCIASFAYKDGGTVYPSLRYLSRLCGYSSRHVIKAVKSLEELGLIEVQRSSSPLGTNVYNINEEALQAHKKCDRLPNLRWLDFPLIEAIWRLKLPRDEKMALLFLVAFDAGRHGEDGRIYPSLAYMARVCGYSIRQMEQALLRLKQRRLIAIGYRQSQYKTNVYIINVEAIKNFKKIEAPPGRRGDSAAYVDELESEEEQVYGSPGAHEIPATAMAQAGCGASDLSAGGHVTPLRSIDRSPIDRRLIYTINGRVNFAHEGPLTSDFAGWPGQMSSRARMIMMVDAFYEHDKDEPGDEPAMVGPGPACSHDGGAGNWPGFDFDTEGQGERAVFGVDEQEAISICDGQDCDGRDRDLEAESRKPNAGISYRSYADDYKERLKAALDRSMIRQAQGEADLSSWPEEVREVVREFCRLWGIKPPDRRAGKRGRSAYADWLSAARDFIDACQGYDPLEILRLLRQDFEQHMRRNNGLAPFVVCSPRSLVKVATAKAGLIATGWGPRPQVKVEKIYLAPGLFGEMWLDGQVRHVRYRRRDGSQAHLEFDASIPSTYIADEVEDVVYFVPYVDEG